MRLVSGRDRAISRARSLKKAWLLTAVACGQRLSADDATIPHYESWSKPRLQAHLTDLESDFEDAIGLLVESPRNALKAAPVSWLSQQFDRWVAAGASVFTIATVQQFEERVGRLVARRVLEVPPYAEVLLQPGPGVALRHPEYMLVRDLGMLVDLYLEAETLCDSISPRRPPTWAGAAGENVQALARSTIQACFNLLESFVSGMARAHVMTNASLDEEVAGKLLSTREPLRKRVRSIPSVIRGEECPFTLDALPLSTLFGEIKRRRDAFVHCEPGPIESEHGYVKEAAFNDIDRDLVPRAVRATHDTIRGLWYFVHQCEGPRWLPPIESSGRFGKINLRLCPPESAGSAGVKLLPPRG